MFRMVCEPIEPMPMNHKGAGGFVTFEGKVRDRNDGQAVQRLEYEAFAPMAEAEGEKILCEAKSIFGLLEAKASHRVGLLEIGETAVWIGVASPHRESAFKACAYVIDEIKKRVPIWKKEHYVNGASEWIGCHDATVPALEQEFYRRQTVLSSIGEVGQARLAGARVLVVGAGGLGSAALPYLAASGVGHIGICDGDPVEISNLHRQVIYDFGDQGLNKAERAAQGLRQLNPFIEVKEHPFRINIENARETVREYDIVIDGTDNFATKFLLNDLCVELKKPLVQASLHQYEGQLLVVDSRSDGGCLRCIWPEAPYDGCVGTCAEAGVLGVLPGVFGVLQANEVIKLVLGIGDVLSEELLTLDLRNYEAMRIKRTKRSECLTCRGDTNAAPRIDIPMGEANELQLVIIDIREPEEWEADALFPCHRVPLGTLAELTKKALANQPCLLVCQSGMRSAQTAREFRAQGITAFSLVGGINSL